MNTLKVLSILLIVGLVSQPADRLGAASKSSASSGTMLAPQSIEYGQVMEVFPYKKQLPDGGLGTAVGGLSGAVLGAAGAGAAGSGLGGTIDGGIAGASVGSGASGSVVSQRWETVFVVLEDGREVVVDQPANKPRLKKRSKVKVFNFPNKVQRVYHRDQYVEWEKNPYID